jgi:hypothetical protein
MPHLSDVTLHLRIAGVLLLCVAASHLVLPRAMGWKVELQRVSLMTRQVSYVHTYFIGLMCALFGLLATTLPGDLLAGDRLAAPILAAAVAVWGSRLAVQLFVFDPILWRGRTLTVAGHGAFVALWSYQTFVFAWALAQHA